jgi:hypothetical protein
MPALPIASDAAGSQLVGLSASAPPVSRMVPRPAARTPGSTAWMAAMAPATLTAKSSIRVAAVWAEGGAICARLAL